MNNNTSRFDSIMARVDEWAETHEGCDCRADAVEEVNFILNHPEYSNMTDDEIVDEAIRAWLIAE